MFNPNKKSSKTKNFFEDQNNLKFRDKEYFFVSNDSSNKDSKSSSKSKRSITNSSLNKEIFQTNKIGSGNLNLNLDLNLNNYENRFDDLESNNSINFNKRISSRFNSNEKLISCCNFNNLEENSTGNFTSNNFNSFFPNSPFKNFTDFNEENKLLNSFTKKEKEKKENDSNLLSDSFLSLSPYKIQKRCEYPGKQISIENAPCHHLIERLENLVSQTTKYDLSESWFNCFAYFYYEDLKEKNKLEGDKSYDFFIKNLNIEGFMKFFKAKYTMLALKVCSIFEFDESQLILFHVFLFKANYSSLIDFFYNFLVIAGITKMQFDGNYNIDYINTRVEKYIDNFKLEKAAELWGVDNNNFEEVLTAIYFSELNYKIQYLPKDLSVNFFYTNQITDKNILTKNLTKIIPKQRKRRRNTRLNPPHLLNPLVEEQVQQNPQNQEQPLPLPQSNQQPSQQMESQNQQSTSIILNFPSQSQQQQEQQIQNNNLEQETSLNINTSRLNPTNFKFFTYKSNIDSNKEKKASKKKKK